MKRAKQPAVRRELAGREELERMLAALTRACATRDVERIRAALAPLGWLRWSTVSADGSREAHADAIGALLRRRGVLRSGLGGMMATAHALLVMVDRAVSALLLGVEHGNPGLVAEGFELVDFDPARAVAHLAGREHVTPEDWRDAVAVGACCVRPSLADALVFRDAMEAMFRVPGAVPAPAGGLAGVVGALVPAWVRRILPSGVRA